MEGEAGGRGGTVHTGALGEEGVVEGRRLEHWRRRHFNIHLYTYTLIYLYTFIYWKRRYKLKWRRLEQWRRRHL